MPGDVRHLEAVMRGRANYSVETFTPSVLGEIPADHIDGLDEVDASARRGGPTCSQSHRSQQRNKGMAIIDWECYLSAIS